MLTRSYTVRAAKDLTIEQIVAEGIKLNKISGENLMTEALLDAKINGENVRKTYHETFPIITDCGITSLSLRTTFAANFIHDGQPLDNTLVIPLGEPTTTHQIEFQNEFTERPDVHRFYSMLKEFPEYHNIEEYLTQTMKPRLETNLITVDTQPEPKYVIHPPIKYLTHHALKQRVFDTEESAINAATQFITDLDKEFRTRRQEFEMNISREYVSEHNQRPISIRQAVTGGTLDWVLEVADELVPTHNYLVVFPTYERN